MMCESTTRWNEGACLRKIRWTCVSWASGRRGERAGRHFLWPAATSAWGSGGSQGAAQAIVSNTITATNTNTEIQNTNTQRHRSGNPGAVCTFLCILLKRSWLAQHCSVQQGRTIVEQWVSGAGSRWWAAAPATSASGRWLQALAGPSSRGELSSTFRLTI